MRVVSWSRRRRRSSVRSGSTAGACAELARRARGLSFCTTFIDQPPPKKLPVNLPPWQPFAPLVHFWPTLTTGGGSLTPFFAAVFWTAVACLAAALCALCFVDACFAAAAAPAVVAADDAVVLVPAAVGACTVTTGGVVLFALVVWPVRPISTPTPSASSSVATPAIKLVLELEVNPRRLRGGDAATAVFGRASRSPPPVRRSPQLMQ